VDGAGHGELWVRRDGRPDQLIYSETREGRERHRLRADLSPLAGQTVTLVFRAVVGDQFVGTLVWERPRLLGETGAMNLATNVLLIVIDTLRADHLGAYGGSARTPNLDRLASSGVRFENAYSTVPITVPSHATMFTGMLPREHGVRNNGQVLGDEHLTLAEILQQAYRRTSAFVSLGVLEASSGVSQGFADYHDTFGLDWWKPAGTLTEEIVSVFGGRRPAPYFLWAHYSDPHEPYAAPTRAYARLVVAAETGRSEVAASGTTVSVPVELPLGRTDVRLDAAGSFDQAVIVDQLAVEHPSVTVACVRGCETSPRTGDSLVERLPATLAVENRTGGTARTALRLRIQEVVSLAETRRRYREEVEYVDEQIGRLLAELGRTGWLHDTLVIVTADHGELLGARGPGLGHIDNLYDVTLRVPLIVSWPGRLPAGKVVTGLASHADLVATVVDLLDLPETAALRGRSLAPLMAGPTGEWADDRSILAETFAPEAPADKQALVTSRFKLILTPSTRRVELYDRATDPAERHDTGASAAPAARLTRELHATVNRTREGRAAVNVQETSEERRNRLRSLGYVR
jgi:arylsulfatase A-like enzyme